MARNKKEKKPIEVPYLPQDIVFNILLRLPAKSLPQLRRVCKQWYNMISDTNFIDTHLRLSQRGILFQNPSPRAPYKTRFVEIQGGELKAQEIWTCRLPRIRASCNGLVLVEHKLNLYVFNPITKRLLKLPPCNLPYKHPKHPMQYEIYGFGYNSCTREYKVVHFCEYKRMPGLGCEIISLGSYSWRELGGPFYGLTQLDIPLSTGGALHWAIGKDYIVSMDVGNEEFHKTLFPNCTMESYHLLEFGEFLSLACRVSFDKIDVWVLKDFSTGDWVKQLCIGAECLRDLDLVNPPPERAIYSQQNSLDHILLVANLRNGELLIFEYYQLHAAGLYAYDCKSQKINKFEDSISMCTIDILSCHFHVNSLVTWKASKNQRWKDI